MKYLTLSCLVIFMLLGWGSCSIGNGGGNGSNGGGSDGTHWYRPGVSVTWQWQLQGQLNPLYSAEIYDIDLFDTTKAKIELLHGQNKKVICYFSAGSYEEWRNDADQFSNADLGNKLDDWIGERWVDVRSENVQTIMINRLVLAQEKNCDGVEPDNVDGYTNNTGFNFTAEDQLAFNRLMAKEAHSRGLAIGLKNNVDQIEQLVEHYDFAVNEQCFEYNECDLLAPFIDNGKPVLNAEYQLKYVNNSGERDALCLNSIERGFSTLILPLALDDTFRFSCL